MLAAMFTICTRARIRRQELDVSTMYALIWILRSIDSQWLSWAHYTVKEFLKAAELHETRPAPPQLHDKCLDGLIRMQGQLLRRCNWRMALDWAKDITPALDQLATCSAHETFNWLCNLSSNELAPITPANPQAPAHRSSEPACSPAAGSGHHSQQQQIPHPADRSPGLQCTESIQKASCTAGSNVLPSCKIGTASPGPFTTSRSRQALAEITSQICNPGGLDGCYWNSHRNRRRNKSRNGC